MTSQQHTSLLAVIILIILGALCFSPELRSVVNDVWQFIITLGGLA
jgi:hypothetical protein